MNASRRNMIFIGALSDLFPDPQVEHGSDLVSRKDRPRYLCLLAKPNNNI